MSSFRREQARQLMNVYRQDLADAALEARVRTAAEAALVRLADGLAAG